VPAILGVAFDSTAVDVKEGDVDVGAGGKSIDGITDPHALNNHEDTTIRTTANGFFFVFIIPSFLPNSS